MADPNDVVGIIPAAGYARRISPLPCSKEIYPIMNPDGTTSVAASYLLESFRKADIQQAYTIIRKEKWDIPAYFKEGRSVGLNLAYIVCGATEGLPQTINKAYSFIKDKRVAFGFPDILLQPSNIFTSLLYEQENTDADLVLGLFEATDPQKMDMVEFNSEEELKDIIIKPDKTNLTQTWIVAVWTPVFSRFLNECVRDRLSVKSRNKEEIHIGDVFRKAIQHGIQTSYKKFKNPYLDIGTPEALKKINDFSCIDKFTSSRDKKA